LRTIFTGFERSKIFDLLYQMQPVYTGILPGLCFRLWISLPAGLCSVFTTFTEWEIQWQHDQSLAKPRPPSKSSWNCMLQIPGLVLLIFMYVLLEGLSYTMVFVPFL